MTRTSIKLKKTVSMLAVVIVLCSLAFTTAYADSFTQRSKAFIASAIQALNIVTQSAVMDTASVIEYIADPMEVTYSEVDFWEDRPEIQIYPDWTVIDGQPYTDIFISNEAAEKFRIDAFDFKTAYQIASQTNGSFASGVGTLEGMPVFNKNGEYITQNYTVPGNAGTYAMGDTTISTRESGRYLIFDATSSGGSNYNSYLYPSDYPVTCWYSTNQNLSSATFRRKDVVGNTGYKNFANFQSQLRPFSYDYVAGTIPADEVLPSDQGMMLRFPSDDGQGNRYFDQWLIDNPEFDQDEPVTIDLTLDPTLETKLNDLLDIIVPIMPIINNNLGDIQFIENHTQPIPPIPDTPIIEATVPQVVQPIINEIQNQGDIISQSIPPIIESIPKIDEICNNIDTAPYHDLDTGLDHLPTVFLPFITDLRSALGIWHYVTTWISQISTTFAFITGCLVGTSIMTPIYAAIAGYMCIKVYRRMTG